MILKISTPKDKIINKVFVPTWDVVITLFFESKINSIYHSLFLKIMKIIAERGDDNMLFCIFIKLNLYSK